MKTTYRCKGVCSSKIHLDIEDGIIRELSFDGGCSGNTQGVALLSIGRSAAEVAQQVRGVRCGFKSTSCPDQLAKAIDAALSADSEGSLQKSGAK